MKAVSLKQIDEDYRNHLQAFLNFAVKAEKKAGKNKTKPVYSKFKQFYDYDKEVSKVKEKDKSKARFSNLGKFIKKGV
jgi:lipopolysaccharide/colanic/teichoic acid biosynthesis glycosyltransferase